MRRWPEVGVRESAVEFRSHKSLQFLGQAGKSRNEKGSRWEPFDYAFAFCGSYSVFTRRDSSRVNTAFAILVVIGCGTGRPPIFLSVPLASNRTASVCQSK